MMRSLNNLKRLLKSFPSMCGTLLTSSKPRVLCLLGSLHFSLHRLLQGLGSHSQDPPCSLRHFGHPKETGMWHQVYNLLNFWKEAKDLWSHVGHAYQTQGLRRRKRLNLTCPNTTWRQGSGTFQELVAIKLIWGILCLGNLLLSYNKWILPLQWCTPRRLCNYVQSTKSCHLNVPC